MCYKSVNATVTIMLPCKSVQLSSHDSFRGSHKLRNIESKLRLCVIVLFEPKTQITEK